MPDFIISGNDDPTAAAEIQAHADREGWGGVDPLTQQRVQFRHTAREAIVQKRGGFFFAFSMSSGGPRVVGPMRSRIAAARAVLAANA